MSKLTLSIDDRIVRAAKRYARRHGTSVSRLVARHLDLLTGAPDDEDFITRLHRDLKREGFEEPPDDLRELRDRHVLTPRSHPPPSPTQPR